MNNPATYIDSHGSFCETFYDEILDLDDPDDKDRSCIAYVQNPIDTGYRYYTDLTVASNASFTSGGMYGCGYSSGAIYSPPGEEVTILYGRENKLPSQLKKNDAVSAWDDYLGPNQTNYNMFTGKYEIDRIFSADGSKSIRFGGHEMRSIGTTKAHFHYETWLYDSASNTVYVENYLQRLK